MGRPSQLVFPDQQTFVAIFENGLQLGRVFRQRVSGARKDRQLRFEAALFLRRSGCRYGTDARETRRPERSASMDSAKESRVRGIRPNGGWFEIKSGDANDVSLAGGRSTSDPGQ